MRDERLFPTPGIAIRVPYVGEEPSPRDRLALLVSEKLLEILSLVSNECGHGWAQDLHGLTVNSLLSDLTCCGTTIWFASVPENQILR